MSFEFVAFRKLYCESREWAALFFIVDVFGGMLYVERSKFFNKVRLCPSTGSGLRRDDGGGRWDS